MHNRSAVIHNPPSIKDWFEARAPLRLAFLKRAGCAGAILQPVGEDCAFRRYFRLQRGGKTVILMEAVPDGNAIATPGHNMQDYIRIGACLRAAGLHTPEIYAVDDENGYILLEDFGDTSFKKALGSGGDREGLYALATDVLSFMREQIGPDDITLPRYYDSHVHKGLRRLVDWYIPAVRAERNPDGLAEEYLSVWGEIERALPPCPQGFLHIDYHFENLMWLPGEQGLKRCGILDYQGAMAGPLPYDLANLLEDARVDVGAALRRIMLDRYCTGMSTAEKEIFGAWYRVLATQFHCRVAGQFIRLAVRDGKDRYLAHLPRVAGYLNEGLRHPVLAPLQKWLAGQEIDFNSVPDIDQATIRPWIRDDAF